MDPAEYDPNRVSPKDGDPRYGYGSGSPGGGGMPGGGYDPGGPGGGPSGGGYGPRGPRRNEKQDEKQDEKEQEKRQEKGAGLDEKYHRDPLGFVGWVVLLIWLGVNLLLQNLDVGVFAEGDGKEWAVFFWGGAVIILTQVLIKLAVPRWRISPVGSFVWGAIWAGVGFGLWYDRWAVIGPIIIIAVGVAILLGRLLPRR